MQMVGCWTIPIMSKCGRGKKQKHFESASWGSQVPAGT